MRIVSHAEILQMIELLAKRRHPSSICPSEVARALRDNEAEWRAMMPSVRSAALELAADGRLLISQRGRLLSADQPIVGAIRLCAVLPVTPTLKDSKSGPGDTQKP